MKSVTKRNGEITAFDESKLKSSLRRVGATEEEIERIANYIHNQFVDGMSTHALYKMAYAHLRSQSSKTAGRYRLKKAIMELGPTGHPFEQLVGELFKSEGYKVQVGIVDKGACVDHELDVVAEKDKSRIMAECKFHNDIRRKSDVKVALYIQSRFVDMRQAWKQQSTDSQMTYEGWIVTNTRFTVDALQYGLCSGLKMISWDYPINMSLRDWIDRAGFHPITVLQSLTKAEKTKLIDEDIILCRNILHDPTVLNILNKSDRQIEKTLEEARLIVEKI